MRNVINNTFATLAKQHYYLYIFIGMIPGYFFVFNVAHKTKISFLKAWGTEVVFVTVLICVFYAFFIALFYGRASKYMRVTRYGFIPKDLYFPTKINSTIVFHKQISGYLYVIFRIFHSMIHGFGASTAFFMWVFARSLNA